MRDHPRVCGEKPDVCSRRKMQRGSPLRMRGKVWKYANFLRHFGITPAYAGKSSTDALCALATRDHPCVCGEKRGCSSDTLGSWGSPLRMRGKAERQTGCSHSNRITPAYAGKSHFSTGLSPCFKDHPCVCGEKRQCQLRPVKYGGSPLRMRGKDKVLEHFLFRSGITPAYAGKSS